MTEWTSTRHIPLTAQVEHSIPLGVHPSGLYIFEDDRFAMVLRYAIDEGVSRAGQVASLAQSADPFPSTISD